MCCCGGKDSRARDSVDNDVVRTSEEKSNDIVNIALALSQYTITSTPKLTFEGFQSWCRVLDVHDADSMIVCFPIQHGSEQIFKFNIRLDGIDGAELTSKNVNLREHAYKARDRLIYLVTGKNVTGVSKTDIKKLFNEIVYLVWLEGCGLDKYGRLLARIYKRKSDTINDDSSINDILVREKYAYAYFGKTKLTEEEQIKVFGLEQ